MEDRISQLETQIKELGCRNGANAAGSAMHHGSSVDDAHESVDEDTYPNLIRPDSSGDGHFLGASSGLHLARSVLESARRNSTTYESHRPPTQSGGETGESDRRTPEEPEMDTSQAHFPPWETTLGLIQVFFRHYEVQYPILVQEEFIKEASNLYHQSADNPWTLFTLCMVLCIALQLTTIEVANSTALAERLRRQATAHLGAVMRSKNHRTLQCLLLLLLSSILNSRSAPIWYISGICMRMCVDLGYHSERTICYADSRATSEDEVDTKRRLFWVAYTFDRSLANMLGRPFFIDDDKIDVKFPTSTLPDACRWPVTHWLKMQRMQSELVARMHVSRKGEEQRTAGTPSHMEWMLHMGEKLHDWLEKAKQRGNLEGPGVEWWEFWYQSARLILHQPTPGASKDSLLTAYEAADTMVRLSFIRSHKDLPSFTWMDIHLQAMSGLTLLFLVLKSPDARKKAVQSWIAFKSCVLEWRVVLDKLAIRWKSMAKTQEVLGRLADETLGAIEAEVFPGHPNSHVRMQTSYVQAESLAAPQVPTSSTAHHGEPHYITNSLGSRTYHQKKVRTRRQSRKANEKEIRTPDSTPQSTVLTNDAVMDQDQTAHIYPYLESRELGLATLFDSLDFPSILGSEFWSELDRFETSAQPSSGFLEQTNVDNGFELDAFGLHWMSSSGRADATLTESVLNFQDSIDETHIA
jgi:hypothetical protein